MNFVYHPTSGAFIGITEDGWIKVRDMFTLMGRFRARFYMCTASATRWGLGSGCDLVSKSCRELATEMKIPCWSGD
eukprot:7774882-Heterocapsa_arctica.AAC.1